MVYGAKNQLTHEDDTSPPLDNQGTKLIQGIADALLYYGRAVDNKSLVGLSSNWSHQAVAMERTKEAINQILDYCATYPADGILYRSSNMVLCAHSDTGVNNKSKGCSREGSHIFLSKKYAMPQWNGSVLTLAQIIKFVMSSASEAEPRAIFITAQKMLAVRNALDEMKYPQPKPKTPMVFFYTSTTIYLTCLLLEDRT